MEIKSTQEIKERAQPDLDEFYCPICEAVMEDPATTLLGHTYERKEIEGWVASKGHDLLGTPLEISQLITNRALKNVIADGEGYTTAAEKLLRFEAHLQGGLRKLDAEITAFQISTIGYTRKDITLPSAWPGLICPLTHKFMLNPVLTRDGWTFDMDALMAWYKAYGTDPITGNSLSSTQLVTNRAIAEITKELKLPRPAAQHTLELGSLQENLQNSKELISAIEQGQKKLTALQEFQASRKTAWRRAAVAVVAAMAIGVWYRRCEIVSDPSEAKILEAVPQSGLSVSNFVIGPPLPPFMCALACTAQEMAVNAFYDAVQRVSDTAISLIDGLFAPRLLSPTIPTEVLAICNSLITQGRPIPRNDLLSALTYTVQQDKESFERLYTATLKTTKGIPRHIRLHRTYENTFNMLVSNAVKNNDLDVLKKIYLVDPEIILRCPLLLHIAITSGHDETIAWLLEIDFEVNQRDKDRVTPLHLAAQAGNNPLVEQLLIKGADLKARANVEIIIGKSTPLFYTAADYARKEGHLSTVEILKTAAAEKYSPIQSIVKKPPSLLTTVPTFFHPVTPESKYSVPQQPFEPFRDPVTGEDTGEGLGELPPDPAPSLEEKESKLFMRG